MNDFWNERFGTKEYAYGEAPNQFFKQELEKLSPGKLLLPAEGEGRNAVFAATLGWQVTAFDPSIEGKKKADLLANKYKVTIDYRIENYESVDLPKASFDSIGLVFAHMHPLKRKEYHQKLASFLKPGGTLIIEGFSKNQIKRNTGGPKNLEMLFSEEELKNDFETDVELNEGPFHQGTVSVIRFVGNK